MGKMRTRKLGAENFRVKHLTKAEGVCARGLALRSLGDPGGGGTGRGGLFARRQCLPWTISFLTASACSQPNAVSYMTRDQYTGRERNAATGAREAPLGGRFGSHELHQFSTKDTEYQSHASFISAHPL